MSQFSLHCLLERSKVMSNSKFLSNFHEFLIIKSDQFISITITMITLLIQVVILINS